MGGAEWLFPYVAEQEEEPRCLNSRLTTDRGESHRPHLVVLGATSKHFSMVLFPSC